MGHLARRILSGNTPHLGRGICVLGFEGRCRLAGQDVPLGVVGEAVDVVLFVAEIGGQAENTDQLLDRGEPAGQRIGRHHRRRGVRGPGQPIAVDIGIEAPGTHRVLPEAGVPAVNQAKW